MLANKRLPTVMAGTGRTGKGKSGGHSGAQAIEDVPGVVEGTAGHEQRHSLTHTHAKAKNTATMQ